MSKSVKNEQKSLKGILLIWKIKNKHINIDEAQSSAEMTVLLLNVKLMDPSFRRLLCLLLTYKVPGGQCAEANSILLHHHALLFVLLRLSEKNGQLSPSLHTLKPSSLRRLIVTLLLFSYT